jgi:hypothetical protein
LVGITSNNIAYLKRHREVEPATKTAPATKTLRRKAVAVT